MRIINETLVMLDRVKNTDIPNFNKETESGFDSFFWHPVNFSGHEVLEKAFTIIGDYEFNKNYKKIINEFTIELETTDGRKIQVGLFDGGIDEMPEIVVADGNIVRTFTVACEKYTGRLLILLYKHYERDTRFEQYYSHHYDCFKKTEDDKTIVVNISNPYAYSFNDDQYRYLLQEELKEEFKQTSFDSIMDLYTFIAEKIDPRTKNFYVAFRDPLTKKDTDLIRIRDNSLDYIKMTKEKNGVTVSVEENLSKKSFTINADSGIEDLMKEITEFRSEQKQIQRKLKKDN